jgi:Carboxylesterase family
MLQHDVCRFIAERRTSEFFFSTTFGLFEQYTGIVYKLLIVVDALQDWMSRHHELEMPYLFGSPFTGISTDGGAPPNDHFNDRDRQLSILMMRLWTNFAKYG